MSQLSVLFALLVGGVLLVPVADRLRVPAPVLCTFLGLVLAAVPGIPSVDFPPELILPLLLPPLLYAAAQRSSWRQFAANARPILLLAVGLVFVTAGAVAVAASMVSPVLPVGAAVVLGAIVAPPDAAAVTAIAGRLGLPRRLVTLLEGEGLFNDVTALTLYQAAVAGTLAGSTSVLGGIGLFGWAVVCAVAVGLVVGFLARLLLDWLPAASLRTALSLLVPYAAYVPADELRGSGVLAVLVAALYLGSQGADPDDVEGRLAGRSFWDVVELMVTGVTFGVVGLELVGILGAARDDPWALAWKSALVIAVVILVRAAWLVPLSALARRWELRHNPQAEVPRDWRGSVLLSWAGMRGVVTVVTALALPVEFPGRDQILVLAMAVVIVTLLVQGLTLPAVVGWLGLRADGDREAADLNRIRIVAGEAAATRLRELQAQGLCPDWLADRLDGWYRSVISSATDEDADAAAERERRKETRVALRVIEAEMLAAARAAVLDLRRSGADPVLADRVLTRLDQRSVLARKP
ncbi:cation:proton antiporter [Longispora albida]|uniref:cation:proton antiporter n=1 Tax=Longispora albida TaxID=203523 RepID=UPI00037EB2D5|nr:sodium:proton antiporter [Longispora albida]